MITRALVSLWLSVTVAALVTFGQSTATVQGTISDLSGGNIPSAKVLIHNNETGEERVAQTDTTGSYGAASLPLGTYRITVSAPGMATTTVTGVTLGVGQTVTQDFTLKVASTTETIEIQAAAPVVETGSVSVSSVINQRTVQEIPLNG